MRRLQPAKSHLAARQHKCQERCGAAHPPQTSSSGVLTHLYHRCAGTASARERGVSAPNMRTRRFGCGGLGFLVGFGFGLVCFCLFLFQNAEDDTSLPLKRPIPACQQGCSVAQAALCRGDCCWSQHTCCSGWVNVCSFLSSGVLVAFGFAQFFLVLGVSYFLLLEYHSSSGIPMEGRVITPKAAQSS